MSSIGQNRHKGMLINRVMLNRGGRDSIYRSGLGIFSRRRDPPLDESAFISSNTRARYREALSQNSDAIYLCSGVYLY